MVRLIDKICVVEVVYIIYNSGLVFTCAKMRLHRCSLLCIFSSATFSGGSFIRSYVSVCVCVCVCVCACVRLICYALRYNYNIPSPGHLCPPQSHTYHGRDDNSHSLSCLPTMASSV